MRGNVRVFSECTVVRNSYYYRAEVRPMSVKICLLGMYLLDCLVPGFEMLGYVFLILGSDKLCGS